MKRWLFVVNVLIIAKVFLSKYYEYTLWVCIFKVRSTLLAGISIVYLNLGFLRFKYTLRVCIIKWEIKDENELAGLQFDAINSNFLYLLLENLS